MRRAFLKARLVVVFTDIWLDCRLEFRNVLVQAHRAWTSQASAGAHQDLEEHVQKLPHDA